MVYHRNQAQFDRARWRKAFLLPFWLAQIVMLMALMGIFSYRLAETVEYFEDNDKKGNVPMVEFVWECTNVGLSLLSLILSIIEISRLVSEILTPFFMLFTHVIKITCALAILALDVVVFTYRTQAHWPIIGLAIDCALLFATIVPGIYSIITFRRLLKYDDYHHPANVKPYGFSTNELELGNSVEVRAGPHNNLSTEYPSQSRSRSQSTSSFSPSLSSLHRHSTGGISTVEQVGRRESYDHRRDTQFEEYVSRKASVSLKEDIDRAIGSEFGWGNGGMNSVERSDSVVGSGTVQTAKARARGDSVGRTKSWGSEHGLVAVPEGIEEDAEDDRDSQGSGSGRHGSGGHQRKVSDDRVLLLGHQTQPSDEHVARPSIETDSRKRRRES